MVPLVRSDLTRPVAEVLLQTDARDNETGIVCTREVPHRELRRFCMRPRSEPRNPEDLWEVEKAWMTDFEAPLEPAAWHVAVRRRLRSRARKAHINDKELLRFGSYWADSFRRGPNGTRFFLLFDSPSGAATTTTKNSAWPWTQCDGRFARCIPGPAESFCSPIPL